MDVAREVRGSGKVEETDTHPVLFPNFPSLLRVLL